MGDEVSLGLATQALTESPPSEPTELLDFTNKQLTVVARQLRSRWNEFASQADANASSPVIAEVSWFGQSTANFYNPSNGRCYQDAAMTLEATDSTAIWQEAVNFCSTKGYGLHASGLWYFNSVPAGPAGEYIIAGSNVDIFGDGYSTCIVIAPGINTVARGGYSAIIGRMDYTVPVNKFSVRRMRFNCNSMFNQWPGSNYGGVAHPQNTAVGIQAGDQVTIDDVTVENHAGVFGVLLGTYGFPNLLTNARVTNCKFLHEGDDPNIGDASVIAGGATNWLIDSNIIDSGKNAAFPTWNFSSAIEAHGTNYTVSNNISRNMLRLLNLAGDSQDATNLQVYGNVCTGSPLGITIFELGGHTLSNMDIHNNLFSLVTGFTSGGGEAGIDTAVWSILGIPDGNGFVNCKIHDNKFFLTGTPTAGPNSVGIRLSANMDNVEVYNNTVKGFGTYGIGAGSTRFGSSVETASAADDTMTCNAFDAVGQIIRFHNEGGGLPGGLTEMVPVYIKSKPTATTCTLSATAGGATIDITSAGTGTQYLMRNWLNGVHIHSNYVQNSGTLGITAVGAAEQTAVFKNLSIMNNTTIDDTGASMQYGIQIAAYTDAGSATWNNKSTGQTTAAFFLDTGSFPNAGQVYQDQTLRTLTTLLPGVGTNTGVGNPSVVLENATASTGAAPQQNSPELLFIGTAWDGAVSKLIEITEQAIGSTTVPSWALGVKVGTAAFQPAFRVTRTVGTNLTTIDSGTGGGAIGINSTGLALYAGAPVAQATRAGQITDSTGSGAGGAAVDVTSAGLADPVKCNDNFHRILTVLNKIEAYLSAAGGGIGVSA